MSAVPKQSLPREKLKRLDASQLRDVELLALLLRTGTVKKNVLDLARQLLHGKRLKDLAAMSLATLCNQYGLGVSKAASIIAAFEISQRILDTDEMKNTIINSPIDVAKQLSEITTAKKEHVVVFLLNARNQLIKKETVSIGTLSASLVHPREVFEPAIRHNSAAIIVAHNHPSGDTTPSDADIQITNQLVKSGEIMGIEILDHIIIASHNYLSMKREGYIK